MSQKDNEFLLRLQSVCSSIRGARVSRCVRPLLGTKNV